MGFSPKHSKSQNSRAREEYANSSGETTQTSGRTQIKKFTQKLQKSKGREGETRRAHPYFLAIKQYFSQ